jgi:hypothetical protein
MDGRRNLLVALAWTALILAMGPGPALAHVTLPASTSGPAGALPWAAGSVLAAFAARRLLTSRARALVLALVLSTAVFTLEVGVHSVHHLGHPESGATCPASVASQNLAWAGAPAVDAGTPAACVTAAPPAPHEDRAQSPLYRPDPGRAPPA